MNGGDVQKEWKRKLREVEGITKPKESVDVQPPLDLLKLRDMTRSIEILSGFARKTCFLGSSEPTGT